MLSFVIASLIGFRLSLVFEAGIKTEMDKYHYSWFCYLSITSGKLSDSKGFYGDQRVFDNRYLTNQEIMEIRNIIDELLEMEEDEDESENSENELIQTSEDDDNISVPVDNATVPDTS